MNTRCQMLFTWDTTDLCIVFRGWHIDGTTSLVFSLFAIVLLTAGYELVREVSRRYEEYKSRGLESGRRDGDDVRGEFESLILYCWVDGWRA
ncbi:copper transpport protein [Neocucurbitaria cava]|uniref:Copper transport protein n=1 Tax=Neocucurbitaria cava TaxID=798079 RepID=A0A9W8YB23_9PLEO|nr:copper transpport protein [Neocucurbitaria cava]